MKKGCICRCTPRDGIVRMDARLLTEMFAYEMRRIRVMPHLRIAAQMALRLGDTCSHTGHTGLAVEAWREAYGMLLYNDYDWVYTPINTRFFRLADLVSKVEACELGRRIDRELKRIGIGELAGFARHARRYYADLWMDKYYEALP